MVIFELRYYEDATPGWRTLTYIHAADLKQMDFCLRELGFSLTDMDDQEDYHIFGKKISYWARPVKSCHVADLKGKL